MVTLQLFLSPPEAIKFNATLVSASKSDSDLLIHYLLHNTCLSNHNFPINRTTYLLHSYIVTNKLTMIVMTWCDL